MTEEAYLDVCRLCMSPGVLSSIFRTDGDATLDIKTMACIDIKLHPEDGLPSFICEMCEKNVNYFYYFKQKCQYIDTKLRSESNASRNIHASKTMAAESDFSSWKLAIKSEYEELMLKIDNELGDSLDDWLPRDSSENMAIDCLEIKTVKEQRLCDDVALDIIPKTEESAGISSKIDNTAKNLPCTKQQSCQCELCGRILKKAVLKKHLLTHTGEKMYSCTICPKKYTRAEHQIVHMRSHTGFRPYICEVCARAFSKSQDLSRHMRIHSDEKNYSCPKCDRKFKRSSDVHVHMRVHTGVRPFHCKTCDKSYRSHSSLRKHQKSHCKLEYSTAESDKIMTNITLAVTV